MNQMQEIAASVPHEYRQKILLEWLPEATASLHNEAMRLLFDAYYIYVDPNGIKNPNCPKCIASVLNNWKNLVEVLTLEEINYNTLESI